MNSIGYNNTKEINVPVPISSIYREGDAASRIYLLLHGYMQKAEELYKLIEPLIPKKQTIIAPNGPFPIPGYFPIKKTSLKKDLIKGYSWYFYDKENDKFLIDYYCPSIVLKELLSSFVKLPITIIGYSQGGYLSLFVSELVYKVDKIIAINSSFRVDKLKNYRKIEVINICSAKDGIIDIKLAEKRYKKLLKLGYRGEFITLEGQGHKLNQKHLSTIGKFI